MAQLRIIVRLAALGGMLALVVWLSYRNDGTTGTTGQSATGELVAYEPARHDLTLRTDIGDRHFVVRDGTPVHEGAKSLTLANLTTATHCRAKVWFGDSNARAVAREIRISCEPTAPASLHR